jgi:hypothetical protein
MIDPESPNNTNHLTTGREQFESVKAILRERQAWLKGELDPVNIEMYHYQVEDIKSEITTINHLFDIWKRNPF